MEAHDREGTCLDPAGNTGISLQFVSVETVGGNGCSETIALAKNHPQKEVDIQDKTPEASTLLHYFRVVRARRGLIYISLASLFYALLGVIVKLCTSVHVFQIGEVRSVFLIFFSCIGLIYNKPKLNYTLCEIKWIVLLACCNSFTQIATFYACKYSSVGDASAIIYSVPALSGVAAWIFLKEPLTCVDIVITVMCIVGIFLISKPSFIFGSSDIEMAENHFIGSLWAVSALLTTTVACIGGRKLRFSASDVYSHTLSQGLVSTCASAILNSLIGRWSCPGDVSQLLYLIGVGVVGFFGMYLFFLSFETENALVCSIVFSSTVFISYVFQFAVFHQYPDVITGVGIIMLMTSVFSVFFRNWRESH